LLVATPAIAAILPQSLLFGVTSTQFSFARLLRGWPFALAACGIFWLAWLQKREQAMIAVALAALAAVAYFKVSVLPELDQRYSVRPFWRANAAQIESACLQDVRRDWVYGLNYYAARALPECSGTPRQNAIRDFPLRIAQP